MMTEQKSITTKTQTVSLSSPKAMANFAKELKKFVVENNLYSSIQGKNYVHVEGWQFAGASIGLYPQLTKLENLSGDGEKFKYRAEVEIVEVKSGKVVGRGVAICSKDESKKQKFDEYAIASMAQTRAVGKAFRLTLGWLMKLAGYEATPAEEIDKTIVEAEIIESEPEIDIEEVKAYVTERLAAMDAISRVRTLKATGKLVEKNLTDYDWRTIYRNLTAEESLGKEEEDGK